MKGVKPMLPPPPPLTDEQLDQMLRWMLSERRAEQMFAWYKPRRPRAFVYAVPPSTS